MEHLVHIEQTIPDRIHVGGGTVMPFRGWAWHPGAAVREVTLRIGPATFPATVIDDVRLHVFALLRRSGQRPPGAIACGFWGLATFDRALPTGRHDVNLTVTWGDGHQETKPLGAVRIESAPAEQHTSPRGGAEPLLAICMATYNPPRAAFGKQIESIRAQTYGNWVCIIQDDCSSAAGQAVIRDVIGNDPQFSIEINRRNLGPYRNFERVLERAPVEAAYVALSDQDDIWLPHKLKTLVDRLEQDRALLVYSDQRIVRADGTLISPTYWTTRRNQFTDLTDLLLANTVTGAASVFRRDLLDIALPFAPRVGDAFHDHWLACCALAAGRISYVDAPLYDYVQHSANVLGYSPFSRWAPLKLAAKMLGLLPAAAVSVVVRRLRPLVRGALTNMIGVYQNEYRRLVVFTRILKLRVPSPAPEKARALDLFTPTLETHWRLFRLGLFGRGRRLATNNAELRLWSGLAVERITARLAPPLLNLILGPGRAGYAAVPLVEDFSIGTREAEHLVAKIAPLTLDVRDDAPVRANIIMPELNLATFFGGYMAKINLAARLVARGHAVRLILVDQQGVRADHLNVIQSEYCVDENIFASVDVDERWDRSLPVAVNANDTFIATTWWTAHIADAALRQLGRSRFLYLIQEYEPFTFPMGSFHAMAHASYGFDHDALFSTRLLEEYFENHGIGALEPRKRGLSLHRFFDNAIVQPPVTHVHAGPRKRLLFYARPEYHAARNLFEIGWAALTRAIERGVFPEDRWEIVTIGSLALPSQLAGRPITNLGKRNLKEYRALLQDYDVGMSLMYTPHPSLVPLEMAAAGMVVVTTTCLNKTEEKLRALSPNFVGAAPTIAGVLEGLARAAEKIEAAPREARLNQVNWSFSWESTFSDDVMIYVEGCLARQLEAAPPSAVSSKVA